MSDTTERATERLFYTADRTELVGEDDPRARFLAAGIGDPIPTVEVAGDGTGVALEPIEEDDPVTTTKEATAKEAIKAPNKAAGKSTTKAGG